MKKYEITSYVVDDQEITGTKQEEIDVPAILVEAVQAAVNDVASHDLILSPAMIIPDKSGVIYLMFEYNEDRKIIGKYNITISKSK